MWDEDGLARGVVAALASRAGRERRYESVCPGCAVEVHGAPAERRPGEELPKAPAIESAKVPRRKRRRERLASEPVAQLEPSEAAESDDVELN